jgi:oligopeptide/dipeptide ABC transporter ATP-binding protein
MTGPEALTAPLLEVADLETFFYTEEGELRAVDGVSFEVRRGRTLALVGESGCGKSVTAFSILRLINPPGKIVGGAVRLHRGIGTSPIDILELPERSDALQDVRGGRVAFVFQEATAALSPVHTIGNQIIEAIRLHQKMSRGGARRVAAEMLDRVGIVDPELCLRQYPHELSGGMRQRAVIAMALVTDPELLIADEPTTALDVTIQAQILALLKRLQQNLRMGILLITHDLGVVSQMADEVAVMYLGKIVERAPVRTIMKRPRHPYTMGLLASLPSLTPVGERLPSIRGSVPALSDVPPGCPFHPRCDYAEPGRCNVGKPPPLARVSLPSGKPPASGSMRSDAGSVTEHAVACWRVREIALERLLAKPPLEQPIESGIRTSESPDEESPA